MFDAVKESERIVNFVRDYYAKNHLKGAVLGISGGKDSGVVAAIMCKALGPENVVGITLPCHSKEADAADAQLVAEKFGVYYMAALLSATRGGTYIVPGTSNACELYVGYFTKGGDSVYDIAPIYSLTVDEVIAVGAVLGVPDKVLYRTPDDGISGLSDEDKLGVKYNDIGKIIKGEDVDETQREKIEKLHRGAAHKFNIPVYKIER